MVAKVSTYIDIISEFKNQGTKQAETSFDHLAKKAKELAKAFGLAFGAVEIIKFGKEAVKLAADENRQFTVLGNTLKNIGLGFASVDAKSFIESTALATGTAIDQLIPAYQKLLTATGDVKKSQEALQLSMDVSAGTGKDLETVTTAISKAYLGNYTGLTRLGAGLDKTLLKTGRMDLIMKQLSATFKGDAAVAADTTAGKMARIGEAARQASVQIGEGLINAFGALTAGGSITKATEQIVTFGTKIGDAIAGIGDLITAIKKIPYAGDLFSHIFKAIGNTSAAVALTNLLAKVHQGTLQKLDVTSPTVQSAIDQGNAAAQAAAIRAANARKAAEAAILASQKASTKELKAQAALKALGSQADDLAKAELLAALQHDMSAEAKLQVQYQLDLLNLQNLSGDALIKATDNAIYLKEQVLKTYGLIQLANGAVVNFATAKNPFEGFDVTLTALLKALYGVNDVMVSIGQNISKANGAALGLSQSLLDKYAGTYQPPVGGTDGIAPYANTNPFTYPSAPPSGLSAADLYNTNPFNINISLDQGLIVSTTNAASAAGSQITINRNQNQFV
jgi:hypothetical protein